MAQKLDFQYFWLIKHINLHFFKCQMIGQTVIIIVKWISCTIILVISQRQASYRQCNRTHVVFLLVICMVNMLSLFKSKRSRLFVC